MKLRPFLMLPMLLAASIAWADDPPVVSPQPDFACTQSKNGHWYCKAVTPNVNPQCDEYPPEFLPKSCTVLTPSTQHHLTLGSGVNYAMQLPSGLTWQVSVDDIACDDDETTPCDYNGLLRDVLEGPTSASLGLGYTMTLRDDIDLVASVLLDYAKDRTSGNDFEPGVELRAIYKDWIVAVEYGHPGLPAGYTTARDWQFGEFDVAIGFRF